MGASTMNSRSLAAPDRDAPRSSLQLALDSGCSTKLQKSLNKRCDQLVTLSSIKRIAQSKMFQWKRKRMNKEIQQLCEALLKTEHGQKLLMAAESPQDVLRLSMLDGN